MAAARAGAQRRARPRRHRATAAEEQVPHLGTGTAGGVAQAQASPSTPLGLGLRTRTGVLGQCLCAEGDGALRLCPVSVCPTGWAWLLLPHRLATRPSMPGCWETDLAGRVPSTQWGCALSGVVSNPPSRPAPLPLRRIDGPERVITVVPDLQAPVFKLSLRGRWALLGLFSRGAQPQQSSHLLGQGTRDRESQYPVVPGEAPRLPARSSQLLSVVPWCGVWRDS